MKKPKIFNDITNIFAKLAGSSDYDPRVKYDTALEYYANQIPVLPSPKDGDNGKVIAVNSDNHYQLADSSGFITVDAELNGNSTNPVQNKAIATMAIRFLEELGGKANEETTVNVSGTTPTITPQANTIYNCVELTSLTISNPPATGAYSIVFTSGSTATTTTIPATILGLENFAPEANTLYEINVLDNRAVVGSWAVSA